MAAPQNPEGRSAAEWAMHQILDLIQNHELGPGDRLPAERDLGTQLGVSRGSVREAISALVTMGVLEARHGAGVFVTALNPITVLPRLTHVLGLLAASHPTEMARLHAQVEGAAAARAAARATPETMVPLSQALAELRLAVQEPPARGSQDRFRSTIAQVSDDRFHRALAGLAADPVAEGMIMMLRGCRANPPASSADDLRVHEALISAIGAHEPDEARNLAERLVLAEHRAPVPVLVRPAAVPVPGGAPAPDWFAGAKFGVIVHWGVYTVPGWAPLPPPRTASVAGPPNQYFAEWYQAAAAEPGSATAEYHQRVHGGRPYQRFQPDFEAVTQRWSPQHLIDDISAAGARYLVMVAKHHDGYLLWPSRVRHPTDQHWRSRRDIVGDLAAAGRRAGLRFGVFYSSGADWSYTGGPSGLGSDAETSRPAGTDYARYVESQWRELIDRYEPDGLWNDTGYPEAGDAHRLIAEYRQRVPDGVVTDRFRTSAVKATEPDRDSTWESIRPIGLSFGWNRQETPGHALSGPDLTLTLLDVVARNGNLLLGVSPDDNGELPAHQRASLRYLGSWLARFGHAVYDTRPWCGGSIRTTDGRAVWLTRNGDRIHLIVEETTGGRAELLDLRLDGVRDLVCVEPAVAVAVTDGRHGSVLDLPTGPAGSPVTVLTGVLGTGVRPSLNDENDDEIVTDAIRM